MSLQNLPVVMMMDRLPGRTGGPTHHGVFDIGYLRLFTTWCVWAADGPEVSAMLDFGLELNCPVAIRYPKAAAKDLGLVEQPIELGKGQVLRWGTDGAICALGPLVELALKAADQLAELGLQVAVINPRFIKPLDLELFERVFRECKFVVTLEESALAGGFGSALLEAACDQRWDMVRVHRTGYPGLFRRARGAGRPVGRSGYFAAEVGRDLWELSGCVSQVG